MEKANKTSFIKNVITLITGSVLAQIISLISLVLLQRFFYGPEDFAPFRLFFEYIAIFVGISALRLDSAIVLEKEEKNAQALVSICIKLIFLTALLSLIFFLIYCNFSSTFNELSNDIRIIILIPLTIIILGSLQVFNSWFTRLESFKLMSVNKVFQNTINSASQLILGFLNFNFIGLIIGKFLGGFSAHLNYLRHYIKKPKVEPLQIDGQKLLIKKHKAFILYTTPGFFIGNLINFIFLALFIAYYGKHFGGQIAASIQYLGISIAIISSSFSQVYFKEITKINTRKELKQTYTYWFFRLGLISLLGVISLQFIPDSFIVFFLGAKWSGLIEIMQVMGIWMAVMFISSSLSYIYIKLGKQKQTLILDVIHLLMVIIGMQWVHSSYESPMTTLWSFTIIQLLFYVIAIFAAYYFISKHKDEIEDQKIIN